MNPRMEAKRRASPFALVMVVIAASILCPLSPPAQGVPYINGKWTSQETPGANWIFVPIHITLTRGYGSHHSQLLWWEGKFGSQFQGGLLGWNPNQTQCDAFPVGSFTGLTVSAPPANIFCAGHSALADGSLLIAGGNEGIEIGIDTSMVFHPDTKQWETQSSMKMAARRWYPTNTTLPSGEVMTFSGSQYNHLLMWGGKSTADPTWTTPSDSLYREVLTPPGPWDPTVLPTPAGTPPEPREGHTAVFYKATTPLMIFGGRKGTADVDLLNDLRPMYVGQVDGGLTYGWTNVSSSNPKPAPRMRHSAVMIDDNTMVVFGGVFQQSVVRVKGDVWKLTPGVGQYVWTEQIPTGTGPSPRSGHAAVDDRDHNRMLVFGGVDSTGAPSDSAVWSLSFASTPPSWSQLTVDPDPSNGRPVMREGHALVMDPLAREHHPGGVRQRNAVLFGGKRGSVLLKDLWILWLPPTGNPYWQKVTASGGPGPRMRFAAIADYANQRLVVTGGQNSGGVTDSTWGIDFASLAGASPSWTTLPRLGKNRCGQAAGWWPGLEYARVPEKFNPATRSWTQMAPKLQEWYPFTMVAPSGNVFYAGPSDTTFLFKPATNQWVKFPASSTSGFKGGTAVQYRPGQFMKCGSRDTGNLTGGNQALTTVKTINVDQFETPANWVTRDTMLARVNHNLTILPNGQVLVSGGTRIIDNTTPTQPMKTPQLWNPNTFTWSPGSGSNALDADPASRGYHSSAILLPDGRVLSVGGNIALPVPDTTNQAWRDMRRVSIFCPPYLFDSIGNLKPRPTFASAPGDLLYNQQFNICNPSSGVSKVVLIKPAAATHAVNMDQRYVPLTFQYCPGNALLVTSPSSSSVAPPGDYLLFLVKSDDTPSIGKWVRVGSPDSPPEDCPCLSGGGGFLAGGGSSGWQPENELLAQGQDSPPLRLRTSLDTSARSYDLRLVQGEGSTTNVDEIALLAIDHSSDVRAFATGSSFVLGTTVPARSVRASTADMQGPRRQRMPPSRPRRETRSKSSATRMAPFPFPSTSRRGVGPGICPVQAPTHG